MKLVVCALDDLDETARRHRPDAVISLLSEDQRRPRVGGDTPQLILHFHDIAGPREGLTAPDGETIARLLEFAAKRRAEDTLLLHCWMGISRSPAAAFILACAAAPQTPEDAIAQALRRAARHAMPNPLLVSLGDGHLGRGGRMIAAASLIGRGESAQSAPFELDTTRFGPLARGAP